MGTVPLSRGIANRTVAQACRGDGQEPQSAAHPLLIGLKDDGLLSAEDDVIADRRMGCDAAMPPFDVGRRFQCYRASAGHPNAVGAKRYAEAIISALGLTR